MAKRSELVSFLSKNHFLVRGRAGPAVELSHTLLDGSCGGRIVLPDSAVHGFFTAYGADLMSHVPLFKMHLDMDFTVQHSDDDLVALLETAHQVARSFFEKEARLIACAVLCEGVRTGTGLHILFPWMLLDSSAALCVRSAMLEAFRKRHAALEADWEKVVDISVLTTNGLRMVGSDKCKDCVICGNGSEARPFCSACSMRGRVPQKRVYWPWRVAPLDASMTAMLADMRLNGAHAARLCSIRAPGRSKTPGFTFPEKGSLVRTRQLGSLADVPLGPGLLRALTSMLCRMDPHFRELTLHSVTSIDAVDAKFIIKVRGAGCRFCLNKGTEHTSQSIYFVASRSGIAQRCFSQKADVRSGGLACADFSSQMVPLSPELAAALFGEKRPRTGPRVPSLLMSF
jgi:hypothetical protein